MADRSRVQSRFLLNRLFAFVVAVVALAGVLTSSLITPLNQIPDEPNHFFRATQISFGSLVGSKDARSGGAELPTNTLLAAGLFDDLVGRPTHKAALATLRNLEWVGWNTRTGFIAFPNTVTYGPVGYIPQAFAVLIGRDAGLGVVRTYYLARLFASVTFVALAGCAIALCRNGALFLALAVSLPMSLFLAGSVSQDGMIIGLSALLAAVTTRLRAGAHWGLGAWALAGLGFGILGMAKPPGVAFALIPLLVVPLSDWRRGWICPAIALALTFAWLVCGVAPAKTALIVDARYSESGQVLWIVHHPAQFLRMLLHTFNHFQWEYADTMIGRLGWLDTFLPDWLHPLALTLLAVALTGAFIVSRHTPDRPSVPTERGALCRAWLSTAGIIAVQVTYVVGIATVLYITWTPVGAPIVDGVQGRYFLPALCFIVCLLPQADLRRANPTIEIVRITTFLAWATTVAVTCVPVLWQRYWPS